MVGINGARIQGAAMKAWWLFVVAGSAALSACAALAPQAAPTPGPFAIAREQALALGQVLAGLRACDGVAWEAAFRDFMAVKRERELNSRQLAVLATMTGVGQAQAGPEMLDCGAAGEARRSAALAAMRPRW